MERIRIKEDNNLEELRVKLSEEVIIMRESDRKYEKNAQGPGC